MTSFEDYLVEKGLKPATILPYRRQVSYFLAWMAGESLSPIQITYSEILDFVDSLKKEDKTPNQLNRMLLALRYYFTYVRSQNKGEIKNQENQENHQNQPNHFNPVSGIHLKGSIRSFPHNLFTSVELEELYEKYTLTDHRTHRNKVMLGLLIYQGITREELETLRPEHIKLRTGKIQIPQTGKRSGRMLDLKPNQILEIQEYVTQVRPQMQTVSERLFTGRKDGESLKNTLLHLNHALRKINPKLKNAIQIRQSTITEWLKEKDLRTVQYWAGHRYVSSTERYNTQDLEALKEALSKYHPLR